MPALARVGDGPERDGRQRASREGGKPGDNSGRRIRESDVEISRRGRCHEVAPTAASDFGYLSRLY